MKRWKYAFLLLPLLTLVLLGCSSGYHHHDRYGSNPYGYGQYGQYGQYGNDPYRIGYQRGYEHGNLDRRYGKDFEYEHDSEFREGISSDRRINDIFRDGYVRGYRDGYSGGSYRRY